MSRKNRSRFLFIIMIAFMLQSCAGVGVFSDAQSEFDRGLAFFNRGQYADAVPHFQKSTEYDPNYARAYLYLGRSYVNMRKWREAIPPLRTAYRISPEETQKEVIDILFDALLGVGLQAIPEK